MKVAVYRVRTWNKRAPIFLTSLMQLTATLTTEALNMYLICNYTDPDKILTSFVQFVFIAQIDDLYARSLKNSFFMSLLKVSKIKTNSTTEDKREMKELTEKSKVSQLMYWATVGIYRLIKIVYSFFYFYFGPFTILVISMMNL